jgi:hypothetical protein
VVKGDPEKVDDLFPLTATLSPSDGERGSPCRSALELFLVGLETRVRYINLSETTALGGNGLVYRILSSTWGGRLLMRPEVFGRLVDYRDQLEANHRMFVRCNLISLIDKILCP